MRSFIFSARYLAIVAFSFLIPTLTQAAPSDIYMGVSPIRDEFTIQRGQTVERTIKFFNNSTATYKIFMSAEDCVTGDNNGTPLCSPRVGSSIDLDKSSSWIRVQTGVFNVPPKSEKIVTYTIRVPENATPGGHYGAIFFNNQDFAQGGNTIAMNRRIGMLYLMNVSGDIVVDTEFGDILIDTENLSEDDIDFFSAPQEYIKRKFNNFIKDPKKTGEKIIQEINPVWEKPTLTSTGFNLTIKVPVKNSGNVHIKPTGKVWLYDGNALLTQVGKQSIIDENGVYLEERIVDFLPINDEGGNVLPDTERIFSANWFGFASITLDKNGKQMISFESPSDYYSRLAQDNGQFIYPWEKLAIRKSQKTLTAKLEIGFKNPKTGKDEIKTVDVPVKIQYIQIARVVNWSLLIIIGLIIFIIYIFVREKKQENHVHELEDEVSHLAHEIAVLEHAQKTAVKKKKTGEKKEDSPKTPSKKPRTKKETGIKKVTPTSEPTETKSDTPAPKKPRTPRAKKPADTPPPQA